MNNAGVMYLGFTEAFTADDLAKQLDVKVMGIHRAVRAFVPAMRQRGQGMVEPGPFATELFGQSPRPADEDGRIPTYPPAAHQAYTQLMGAFEGMLTATNTPNDPALFVEQVTALIDTPAGQRPLRTVVGVDAGVRDRNAAVAPFDAVVLSAFGMTEFTTLALSKT